MTSPRTRLISTLAALTCSTLLLGCAQTRPAPQAAALPASTRSADSDARRAEIRKQLAALCPTPTQWTPGQMVAVAAFIEKHAGEQGTSLLAGEWERLNKGARLCRGAT